ncbi:hypothetical protein [Streptomyces sp. NPDC058268]
MDPAEHMRLTTRAIAEDRIKAAARTPATEPEDDEYADDQPTPERRPA